MLSVDALREAIRPLFLFHFQFNVHFQIAAKDSLEEIWLKITIIQYFGDDLNLNCVKNLTRYKHCAQNYNVVEEAYRFVD
jgi:hypothetical protein